MDSCQVEAAGMQNERQYACRKDRLYQLGKEHGKDNNCSAVSISKD
jgi:hypothetical protein